jgi:hypothetical protein
VTVHQQASPPSYRCALETARALGRADGRVEAELTVDPAVDPGPAAVDPGPAAAGPWCRGLDPERFAALVWGAAAGAAPAGVVLNAPLWYAQGFREALALARSDRHPAAAHPVPRPRSEPA